jgi:predicted transcriptional regulator
MTTLKVGIASYEDMKARTLAVARGDLRVAPDEPRIWFTSTESFAKVLSAGNRDLLRIIVEQAPVSTNCAHDRQGEVQPVAHAADDGSLRPRATGPRRAGANHAEGDA